MRRLGNRVRVTAQLIDAARHPNSGPNVMTSTRTTSSRSRMRLGATIIVTLVGRLQAAGAEIARRKAPTSLAAYEYVLRGDALPLDSPEAEAEARRLYEKAIAIDPGYGRAYALLAYLVHLEWLRDMSGSDRLLDRAFELATKAVALDENDGTCQALLGLIQLNRQSYALAEHHYLKALELNHNSSSLMAVRRFPLRLSRKAREGHDLLRGSEAARSLLRPALVPGRRWASCTSSPAATTMRSQPSPARRACHSGDIRIWRRRTRSPGGRIAPTIARPRSSASCPTFR